MTTKAERRAAIQEEIVAALPDVDEQHRPSPYQYTTWREFVEWNDGCDPDGYFMGDCPTGEAHPARFNFLKGVVRCDDNCFPTPTISLVNALSIIS